MQGNAGQNLGSAADQGRSLVQGDVTRSHAHGSRPKVSAEIEKLLTRQRLRRGGVVSFAAFCKRLEECRNRNQGLSTPCRCVQHDMGTGEYLHDGLLLGFIELDTSLFKCLQQGIL